MPIGEKRKQERALERQKKIGEKFNWLTIHSEGELVENNCRTFNCICDCGNIVKNVLYKDVRRGWPRSCGCKNRGIINYEPENLKNKIQKYVKISEKGCWEWQKCKAHGYGRMIFKGKLGHAHRISYELYIGKIPENMQVLHKCDNRCCVNPEHLFLGTHEDNMRDMVIKNRAGKPSIRKDKKTVIEIRKLNKSLSMEKLSEIYDSDYTTIRNIINRKTYESF